MSFYISIGVTFEIFLILLSVFSEIRRYTSSIVEAYVYATVLLLSILSVSIQFFFLFGIHSYYPVFEIILMTISFYLTCRNRQLLFESYISVKKFCADNPFYTFLLTFFGLCLLSKGFLLPPTTFDSMTYHLPRIMMMQSEGNFFLENFADYRQDIMPIGYDILNFLYLRFFTDYGLTTFAFLSYTIILSGIFALVVKIFSDIQLAKIISLISASLTMFVVHSFSTKNDLILAAIAIVCFISAYNLLKESGYIHLLILLVALTFGSNAKFTFGVFVLPFILFYGILLFKRFGFQSILALINKENVKYIPPLMLPLCTIFIICVLFIHNYSKYGALMGPNFYLYSFSCKDGWVGSFLNPVRYFFQAIDLPTELGGDIFSKFHDLALGKFKSTGVFSPDLIVKLSGSLNPPDISAWYGLMGMPILISILFTIIRGKGFLRIIALSISIFAIIIAIKVPWNPWSGRYFALTFAGGLICFAFMLKCIAKKSHCISKCMVRSVIIISAINLFYLVLYVNILNFSQLKYHYKNRDSVYSTFYQKGLFDAFIETVPHHSKVLLVTGVNVRIFPLLIRRPDLDITVTGVPGIPSYNMLRNGIFYRELFKLKGKKYDLSKRRDFQAVQKYFDITMLIPYPEPI